MSKQHCVIVGGSSGIGLSTAKWLLKAGYKVTITGRNLEKLNEASHFLEGQEEKMVMNAADRKSVQTALNAIGAFDHLVLAVGSTKGAGPFASVNMDDVRTSFEEKVFPHFQTAQAALRFLATDGSITFVSAVTAHAAMPGTAGIGAANAAIAALVPILAAELKPLRVNAVSPGVIDTPWWNFLSEDQRAQVFADYATRTPVGRVGHPDDIAQTIAFLITNRFMTGEVVICDGGLRLMV
jgi:NAD(P)-dependent dehydrogenase (short-subunit alcohol dehydrogenase family)